MSLLTNLKLNYITKLLQDVENTTANSDVLNAVIKYINDNKDKFEPDIDITALNQFVENYINKNNNLFQGQPGPPVAESDIISALDTYFKSTVVINFINATFKNLVCGNTTLQFYDSTGQTDSQFDITSNNVKCKKLTLSNIYAPANGNVVSDEPEIKFNHLINALQGIKTNLLITESIQINQLLNIGRNNFLNKITGSTENDIITEYLQTRYLNGKPQTINLVDGISSNFTTINCNDVLICKKGIVASQIYCDFPPGITNARILQIGINDNDNLIVRAGASFRKPVFCGNNLFNNNPNGSTEIDLSTVNLVATNISNRGNNINFKDNVSIGSITLNKNDSTITTRTINGVNRNLGFTLGGISEDTYVDFPNIALFRGNIYLNQIIGLPNSSNQRIIKLGLTSDDALLVAATPLFITKPIFNTGLTVNCGENGGISAINDSGQATDIKFNNNINLSGKTLTLSSLIVEQDIVYRQGRINPLFGVANNNIDTTLSGNLDIVGSTWSSQINLITSDIVLNSPLAVGFQLARPAGSIFGFCNNTLPPSRLNINYITSNGVTRNYEYIEAGHCAMFILAGNGYSRISV